MERWKVIDWSKEELFGSKIDHKILNKIRFAIPSVELAKAFYPEAKAIDEKVYKNMKLKLLDWAICRVLITNPNHVAAKLRGRNIQQDTVENFLLRNNKSVCLFQRTDFRHIGNGCRIT